MITRYFKHGDEWSSTTFSTADEFSVPVEENIADVATAHGWKVDEVTCQVTDGVDPRTSVVSPPQPEVKPETLQSKVEAFLTSLTSDPAVDERTQAALTALLRTLQ